MSWTIPNILTVLRLLAAPGVAVMFLYFTRPFADWFALILFVGAAATDWFDGYLARAWKQETKLGAMLDPIADKAMVVIALMVIVGYSSMSPWLVLPATFILFREVFVSGLREFLGDTAGTLKVTKLAKWKTTAADGRHRRPVRAGRVRALSRHVDHGHGRAMVGGHPRGRQDDLLGLGWKDAGMVWSGHIGIALLWIAALLTVVTGWDYFAQGTAASEGRAMIDVLYFAWVRERIGLPKERVETRAATVADLVAELLRARSATRRPSPISPRCGSRSTRSSPISTRPFAAREKSPSFRR